MESGSSDTDGRVMLRKIVAKLPRSRAISGAGAAADRRASQLLTRLGGADGETPDRISGYHRELRVGWRPADRRAHQIGVYLQIRSGT
jgi:hypothetical protein